LNPAQPLRLTLTNEETGAVVASYEVSREQPFLDLLVQVSAQWQDLAHQAQALRLIAEIAARGQLAPPTPSTIYITTPADEEAA
jgi:hypothetical protein